MSKNMEEIINSKRITILNKIIHKPILFDYIFPYIEKRPIIFSQLIDNDGILKEKIINIIKIISTSNKLSNNINNNIYKFLLCRFLSEIDIEIIMKELKEKMIKESNEAECLIPYYLMDHYFRTTNQIRRCILDYIIIIIFEKIQQKVNSIMNIEIKYSKEIHKAYKRKDFINFYIMSYLNIQKKLLLYHLPLNIKEDFQNEYIEEDNDDDDDDCYKYYNFKWNKRNIFGDSYYLNNLNKDINQKISLICKINQNIYDKNPIQIEYNNIYKLYFLLYEKDKNNIEVNKNIFEIINKYLIAIKHKDNIEEIYFSNAFFNEEKNGFIYEKLHIEKILKQFSKILEKENLDYNWKSLKNIEFNDDKVKNNIRRFKLRYNFNKIFRFNIWSKIIIINFKEIENCDEKMTEDKNIYNKIHEIEKENTNLKILLIDFEHNSPYQKNFYYFCKKYLDNNPNINMLVFHKIGNNNNDEYFQNNNNEKIALPNLTQVFYEKNNKDKNNNDINIYNFIKKFFYINKFLIYEGLDDKNNINYLNLSFKNMQEDEINRIFLDENRISILNLKKENIQIKYNRIKNHLIINNNNNRLKTQESKDLNISISFFSNLIRGIYNLQKLTINGFDFSFYDLINSNIISLSINSLSEFASKNFKHINNYNSKDYENDWKQFNSFQYLQLFKNLKYITISGNLKLLEEIITNLGKNKNMQKIKFYTSENDKNKFTNIQKKLKFKNITLEIVKTNTNNNIKYENEEKIEEVKYFDDQDNGCYKIKINLIQNLNWLNSFDSKIIKNIDRKYIKKIMNLFSDIYPLMDIQPYNFILIKRYKISDIKIENRNKNFFDAYFQKKNLLIIINDINNKEFFHGFYKFEKGNNKKGIIFSKYGKYEYDCIKFIIEFDDDYFIVEDYHHLNLLYVKCNFIELFEL